MSAAKYVKYGLVHEVPAEYISKSRSAKTNKGTSVRTDTSTRSHHTPSAERAAFDSVLSVSGKALPEGLVRALKSYTPTEFKTKTKEDLLSMLVQVR